RAAPTPPAMTVTGPSGWSFWSVSDTVADPIAASMWCTHARSAASEEPPVPQGYARDAGLWGRARSAEAARANRSGTPTEAPAMDSKAPRATSDGLATYAGTAGLARRPDRCRRLTVVAAVTCVCASLLVGSR